MAQVRLNCPHCHTKAAGFTVQGSYQRLSGSYQYVALLQCGVCDEGVVGRFSGGLFQDWIREGKYARDVRLLETWPKPGAVKAPASAPPNVERYFLQGMAAFEAGGYDAAGAMFRKCLDVALKVICPGGTGTLEKRINDLPAELGVTSSMRRWAHAIRRLGNDAVHDEEPFDKTEADDLRGFTEVFLTYAFTLPVMIEERFSKEPAE